MGVTVKGGAVRDLFLDGVVPADIDIGWSRDTQTLKTAVQNEFHADCGNPEGEWGEEFQYLLFGRRETGAAASKFDPLEGNHKAAFGMTECTPENSVNALQYDPVQQVLIDPTGFGVGDVCGMRFRLPPDCLSAETWLGTNGGQTALRFYKMYQKGFAVADDGDLVFLFGCLELQARGAVEGQELLTEEAWEFFRELRRDGKQFGTRTAGVAVVKEMKRAVMKEIDAIAGDIAVGYVRAMVPKLVRRSAAKKAEA